jgi:hypothetical protein
MTGRTPKGECQVLEDYWEKDKILVIMVTVMVGFLISLIIVMGFMIYDESENSHNYIPEGTVVKMEFIEEHDEWSGKILMHREDEFILTITNGDKRYHFDVPKSVFNGLRVGDYYK